jgi:hypothetical protein
MDCEPRSHGTPAFAVPNPAPKFPLSAAEAAPFLEGLPDHEYAEAIGALLAAPNISKLSIKPSDSIKT